MVDIADTDIGIPFPLRLQSTAAAHSAYLLVNADTRGGRLAALNALCSAACARVVECVTQLAKLLHMGAFVGTTGPACCLLVGQRGGGKSVILEALASVVETALPTIIPVYVTFADVERTGGAFVDVELETLIARAMATRGLVPHVPTLEGIKPALRAAGRRVLLIVDEIDAA